MILYGKNIATDSDALTSRKTYCFAMEELRRLSKKHKFYPAYREYGSVLVAKNRAKQDLFSVHLKSAVEYIVSILNDGEIYDYDERRVVEVYRKYATSYLGACAEMYAQYCEIQGNADDAKQARAQAKATRGRFVGGGFGFNGAIKGIAMAGAANMATGALYSVGNMVGNTFSKLSADSQCERLFRNPKTVHFLQSALEQDFLAGTDVFEEIFVKKFGSSMANPFSDERHSKAKAIMKNIENGVIPPEKQIDQLLLTMMYDAPYYDDLYVFAYEKFGDDNGKLFEFAELFGKYDIVERIKEKIADKQADAEMDAAEREFFGANYDIVQSVLRINSDQFADYSDYYIHAYIEKCWNKGYTPLICHLMEQEQIPQVLKNDLVLFDKLPVSERNKKIQEYKMLCGVNDLFDDDEHAYMFINRSSGSAVDKGFLVTSKGIYFSPKCKSSVPLMRYDQIDGIVEGDCGQSDIIYDKKPIFVFAGLGYDVSNLLTLTVLYFKYGDSKITGKTVSELTKTEISAKEKQMQKEERKDQIEEKVADISAKLFVFALLAGIVLLACKMCGA